jgi:hypothetical protein
MLIKAAEPARDRIGWPKRRGSAAGRSIVAALPEEPARPPILSGGRLACRNFPLLPDRCKTSGSWHPVHPGPLAQIGLSVTIGLHPENCAEMR